jgi:hypothetical protein
MYFIIIYSSDTFMLSLLIFFFQSESQALRMFDRSKSEMTSHLRSNEERVQFDSVSTVCICTKLGFFAIDIHQTYMCVVEQTCQNMHGSFSKSIFGGPS